jgi:hypothetical protein
VVLIRVLRVGGGGARDGVRQVTPMLAYRTSVRNTRK